MTKDQQAHLFKEALKLTEQQFLSKYKFPPPKKNDLLIFYSSTGKRSDWITDVAKGMGYNSKSLIGGSRLWNKYYGPDNGIGF